MIRVYERVTHMALRIKKENFDSLDSILQIHHRFAFAHHGVLFTSNCGSRNFHRKNTRRIGVEQHFTFGYSHDLNPSNIEAVLLMRVDFRFADNRFRRKRYLQDTVHTPLFSLLAESFSVDEPNTVTVSLHTHLIKMRFASKWSHSLCTAMPL